MTNFLLGILFAYILLPILESITNSICTAIEIIRAKCSLKITEYNSKIAQINMSEEAPVAHPIGFHYTPTEEEDEEEYED